MNIFKDLLENNMKIERKIAKLCRPIDSIKKEIEVYKNKNGRREKKMTAHTKMGLEKIRSKLDKIDKEYLKLLNELAPDNSPQKDFIFKRLQSNEQIRWCRSTTNMKNKVNIRYTSEALVEWAGYVSGIKYLCENPTPKGEQLIKDCGLDINQEHEIHYACYNHRGVVFDKNPVAGVSRARLNTIDGFDGSRLLKNPLVRELESAFVTSYHNTISSKNNNKEITWSLIPTIWEILYDIPKVREIQRTIGKMPSIKSITKDISKWNQTTKNNQREIDFWIVKAIKLAKKIEQKPEGEKQLYAIGHEYCISQPITARSVDEVYLITILTSLYKRKNPRLYNFKDVYLLKKEKTEKFSIFK